MKDSEPDTDSGTDSEESEDEDTDDDASGDAGQQEKSKKDYPADYTFEEELKWPAQQIADLPKKERLDLTRALRDLFDRISNETKPSGPDATADEWRDAFNKNKDIVRLKPLRNKLVLALDVPPEIMKKTHDAAAETLDDVLGDEATLVALKASDKVSSEKIAVPTLAALKHQLTAAQAITDRYLKKLGVGYKVKIVQKRLPIGEGTEYGAYEHREKQLILNSLSMALLSKNKLVGTVMHELTHCYQHWVADMCRDSSNQDFDTAVIFWLNFDLYIPDKDGMAEYEGQPVEAQAIAVQKAIDDKCRDIKLA